MATRTFDMALALSKTGTGKVVAVSIDGNRLTLPGRPKAYTDDGLCTLLDGLPKESKLAVTEPAQVTETGIIARPKSQQDPRDVATIIRDRHAFLTSPDDTGNGNGSGKNRVKNARNGIDPALTAPSANGNGAAAS